MRGFLLLYLRRRARFLTRITPRFDLAEEIINDTMFMVWQQAARFRADSRVSTWVMGIAFRHGMRSGLQPLVLAITTMETAAIVLLGVLLARPFAPADYTTLADPAAAPGRPALRVLFAPELPVGERPALLGRIGAEISYGPSESGVYTLVRGPGRSPKAALATLRSDAQIRFAEPVRGAGPRASP